LIEFQASDKIKEQGEDKKIEEYARKKEELD
jgi:hypothetical protein